MKKTLLLSIFFLCAITAYSQNYLKIATACFEKGDYECAKTNYENYKLHAGKRAKDVSDKIKNANTCQYLLSLAHNLYLVGNHVKALEEYQQVLELNPNDPLALEQITKIRSEEKIKNGDVLFPGGPEALIKFLLQNITYPKAAAKDGAKGVVVLKFKINTQGEVSDIEIIQRAHPALEAEAVRVVKMMPKWIPARENGENINSYVTLPIKFYGEPNLFYHTIDE